MEDSFNGHGNAKIQWVRMRKYCIPSQGTTRNYKPRALASDGEKFFSLYGAVAHALAMFCRYAVIDNAMEIQAAHELHEELLTAVIAHPQLLSGNSTILVDSQVGPLCSFNAHHCRAGNVFFPNTELPNWIFQCHPLPITCRGCICLRKMMVFVDAFSSCCSHSVPTAVWCHRR